MTVSYLRWCFSGCLFEYLAKIRGGTEAKQIADLLYGQIGGNKQLCRFFRKNLVTNFYRGLSKVLAEFDEKIAFTYPAMTGNICHVIAMVGVHKCKCRIQNLIGLTSFRNGHLGKKRSQQAVQRPNRDGIDLHILLQLSKKGNFLGAAVQLLQLQVRGRCQGDQGKTKGGKYDRAVFGRPVNVILLPLWNEEIISLLQLQIDSPGDDSGLSGYDSADKMKGAAIYLHRVVALAFKQIESKAFKKLCI